MTSTSTTATTVTNTACFHYNTHASCSTLALFFEQNPFLEFDLCRIQRRAASIRSCSKRRDDGFTITGFVSQILSYHSSIHLIDTSSLTEMSLRRLKFDVEALVAVAAKASGASEGNEIAVVAEGTWDLFVHMS